MIVEPFLGPTGVGAAAIDLDGFRVRQDSLGRPAFSVVPDVVCTHNFLFNDVVCDGARGAVAVTAGDGDDVVVASGMPGGKELLTVTRTITAGATSRSFQIPEVGATVLCIEGEVPPPVVFVVNAGPGADFVGALGPPPGCAVGMRPEASILPVLAADGGPGNDVIGGGPGGDTLAGGSEGDIVDGGDGDDVLRGDGGNDQLFGGPGNDQFGSVAGDGADVIDGGPGAADEVFYTGAEPVTVTVGAGADDGRPGEGDFVGATVERVTGGSSNDVMTGDRGPNRFTGVQGADRLAGGAGNDALIGGEGGDRLIGEAGNDVMTGNAGADGLSGGPDRDTLDGGPGSDALEGGDGNDVLRDRDGERDLVSCGAGLFDAAEIDLQDAVRGCEVLDRAPADDGLPAYASGRRLRLSGSGTVSVRVSCPRRAKVRCSGTLELRRGSARGKLLGSASYDVRLGGTGIARVSIAGALPAVGGRVAALTSEQGASEIGPRSSVRPLEVA
jgi:hypothetical protein